MRRYWASVVDEALVVRDPTDAGGDDVLDWSVTLVEDESGEEFVVDHDTVLAAMQRIVADRDTIRMNISGSFWQAPAADSGLTAGRTLTNIIWKTTSLRFWRRSDSDMEAWQCCVLLPRNGSAKRSCNGPNARGNRLQPRNAPRSHTENC
jgi:hypothetical protein